MASELQKRLAQCERQQQQLWAFRPLSKETLQSLREYYRIGLTYTSNAPEGKADKKLIVFRGVAKKGGYYPIF